MKNVQTNVVFWIIHTKRDLHQLHFLNCFTIFIIFANIKHYSDTGRYIFVFMVYKIYCSFYREPVHIKHYEISAVTFLPHNHRRKCCQSSSVHNSIFYSFSIGAMPTSIKHYSFFIKQSFKLISICTSLFSGNKIFTIQI